MNRTNALIALALAGCTSLVPSIAEAQGLFERLFGPPKRRVVYVDEFPAAPQRPKRSKQSGSAKPLISAPSYYTYRADPLVKVDFAKLALVPPDAAVPADAFRESAPVLTGFDLRAEKPVASAILEHYSKNPAFLWVSSGAVSPRASDAVRVLSEADSYGLSPEDYAVAEPRLTGDKAADGQELMRFETALTAKVLRNAMRGRGRTCS